MVYNVPPLELTAVSIRDALGEITLQDLPNPKPDNECSLKNPSPIIERLWRIALSDIESNIVSNEEGHYFGAGKNFGLTVYTRDISYSGLLGCNRLYPEIMWSSIKFTRDVRKKIGLKIPKTYFVEEIPAKWEVIDLDDKEFRDKYHTNHYARRTDDVVWLWCAEDLINRGAQHEWPWVYETGKHFFAEFYDPFFDPSDGLYRAQATFVDIHWPCRPSTGYPQNWGIEDCLLIKTISTNCLYVKGLEVMARAARECGKEIEAKEWEKRAIKLREAILRELGNPNGTFAYFKDRHGQKDNRRDALGTALAVLLDIVSGNDAKKAMEGYPVTDAGVPLFDPFYPVDNFYHNNTSWPFVDTFFFRALEQCTVEDHTARNAALLARTCRPDGCFHEVVDMRDKSIKGSSNQLWTAAAFIDVCYRAGLVE